MGLGQTLGPLAGGELFSLYGFRSTQDVVGLVCIAFAVIYTILGTGWQGWI